MFKEKYRNEVQESFIKFSLILIVVLIYSYIAHGLLIQYIDIYHTILELFCVFISSAIYISIWYNYERNTFENYVFAFGFLSIAIFDALHIFYHFKLNLAASSYYDLSTIFGILGRLTEAFVILSAMRTPKYKINKWIGLFVTLIATLSVSYFVVYNHDYLPLLRSSEGVTPIKVVLGCIVIGIYIVSLYFIKYKKRNEGIITYKYILVALLTMIASEFCFTLYSSMTSFPWTLGHILKITSFYFLFKGIFISTLVYPYKKLEARNRQLDIINGRLEEANKNIGQMSVTLDDILNSVPSGICMYGNDSKLKYVNKKFEDLYECNRENFYGLSRKDVRRIYPWVDKEKNPMPETEYTFDTNHYNVVRTIRIGENKYKKMSIDSIDINDGTLLIFNDAKKEQELENFHLQTETILNSVSSCVLMVDNNRNIIMCNRALEEILEMNKEEIIDMNIDDLHRLIGLSVKGDLDKDSKAYEAAFTSIKGSKKEVLVNSAPIINVDGETMGRIKIINDVTEINKEHLKIRRQEKLALLGQLGAGIVHETRNYLTTIKGRSQIIEMISEDEHIKNHAGKINTEIDDVNRIISEFLFLSKPRETELQEVSMFDVCQSIKSIVETSSISKGVETELRLSKDERYLLCDEIQIKQVMLNICKNAVDAMAGVENPKLVIEAGYNKINNEMFIKVSDVGKGIPPKDLEKLGTMFFTTKKSGTGLGLNICYQILQEHGGRIDVDSKVGEGTTFTLVLPCIEDEEEEEAI